MSAGSVIGFVVVFLCAFVMIFIGVAQIRQKNPVGFYTGEKAPRAEEVKNVAIWNKSHGIMWIAYGCIMILGYIAGRCIEEKIWSSILFMGSIVVPIPVMMWIHHRIIKIYGC